MSTCERCQSMFSCAVADQTGTECWCVSLPKLRIRELPDLDSTQTTCLCPACLRTYIAEKNAHKNKED